MSSVVLLGSTTELTKTGQAINVISIKRDRDALYTVTISVEDFCGRIFIQGTLVKNPKAGDWFNIKINDNRYIDYPLDPNHPRDTRVGAFGDTAVDKFNFAGNYLQIRAVVDKTAVPTQSGRVVQITLSDEYSSDLHNVPQPPPIVVPPNPNPQGTGTTVEYATVTVDKFGKVTNISAGDPTKISAQTYVVDLYSKLAAITPQIGDSALVTSPVDPLHGYYLYNGTAWHGLNDGDLSINKNVTAGTYTNATVQVDSYGRVISAQSGIINPPATTSRSAVFSAATPEVTMEALPPNARVNKIVLEIIDAFDPTCDLQLVDDVSTVISSDEILFEDGNETSVFEMSKMYTTGGLFKLLVNSNGTQSGSGKITIDFALN
jgi:hypothetical protein